MNRSAGQFVLIVGAGELVAVGGMAVGGTMIGVAVGAAVLVAVGGNVGAVVGVPVGVGMTLGTVGLVI